MSRLIIRLMLALLPGCGLLLLAARGAGQLSPDDDRIMFASDRFGSLDIFALDIDRGLTYTVVRQPGNDWMPAPAPDGRRLAYVSDREGNLRLFVRDLVTGDSWRVGDPGAEQPAWSPDGRQLAFVIRAGRDNSADIYVLDTDCMTCPPRPLLAGESNDFAPAFSPDGRWLAFISNRDQTRDHDIFLLDLTAPETPPRRLAPTPLTELFVSWSPDSTRLAYTLPGEIRVADASSGRNTAVLSGSPYVNYTGTSWLPDGRLLFSSWTADGNQEVFVLKTDCQGSPGGCAAAPRPVTLHPAVDFDAHWWP